MTHQAVLVTDGALQTEVGMLEGTGGGRRSFLIVGVPYQTLKKSKIDYKEQGCNSI